MNRRRLLTQTALWTTAPTALAALTACAPGHIAAGPLVRSSYHADEHVPQPQPGTGPLAATGS
jgi:hypothetical protein